MLRGTDLAEYFAVRRFTFSLQDISTPTGRICLALNRWNIIFLSRVKCTPLFFQTNTGFWNHSQSSPFAVTGFSHFVGKLLCLPTSFCFYHSRITVYKKRFSLLKFHQCNRQRSKKFLSCKSGNYTADTFFCQFLTELRPCDCIHMSRIKEDIRTSF